MLRDLAERCFWTFVATAGGALIAPAVFSFDIAAWQAAVIAGTGSVVNAITVFARWRVSQLPNPGDGLPGLRTDG